MAVRCIDLLTLFLFFFVYIYFFTGESKEITISFNPDHASELYADEVSVEINNGVSNLTLDRVHGPYSNNTVN